MSGKEADNFWTRVRKQYFRRFFPAFSFWVVLVICLLGVYAPFLASNKPLFVSYQGEWYFPLFRYLFFPGFYTKRIDLFFNLLMFTLPLFLIAVRWRWKGAFFAVSVQVFLFGLILLFPQNDPASDANLNIKRQKALQSSSIPYTWEFVLDHLTPYEKLNMLTEYRRNLHQQKRLEKYLPEYNKLEEDKYGHIAPFPTLWNMHRLHYEETIDRLKKKKTTQKEERRKFFIDRRDWIEKESQNLRSVVMPLLRPFHWEEDAGGSQTLNLVLDWWEVTRINRKDLMAGLIFGIRISIVVGIAAVSIALAIGVPVGAAAGYFGGKFDIIVCRLLEIWESMPTFFMLLLVVGILQSKSIFLVIFVIGLFSWTSFSRFIRGEFFKQRNLPYVESCHAQGFSTRYIIFRHILPNAVPPLLTLVPFAVMGAITVEAGLSFLGLGEEGSCSWGVLMDEGRQAFPGESYLLWPPAIFLTILLIAVALVGDGLRDAIDPKLHSKDD